MPEPSAAEKYLEPQFDDLEQQREAAGLAMWGFLVTEVMFFGGLFTAYLVYRMNYPQAFSEASHHLYMWIGAVNTAILLASSLTMALAVWAAGADARRSQVVFLALTLFLGLAFLGLKGYEYHLDVHDRILPGAMFDASKFEDPAHAEMFMVIYFIMTGIHALHLLIGVGVVVVIMVQAWRGRYSAEYYNPVEMTGLYWHFVDIIWIYLFPLLYLIGV